MSGHHWKQLPEVFEAGTLKKWTSAQSKSDISFLEGQIICKLSLFVYIFWHDAENGNALHLLFMCETWSY